MSQDPTETPGTIATSIGPDQMSAALPSVPLWVNGKRVTARGADSAIVCNPSNGTALRRVPFASRDDVADAVASAEAAFPSWRATTPLNRARILMRFRELLHEYRGELARLISEENGKTFADASGSVQRGIEVVEFASGAPHLQKGEHAADVGRGVDCHSVLQPIGVCVGITPFNFPAMVPLWMFPIAIVCGNTFVLKPSEKVPSTSLMLAELMQTAGLPPGVLNVVHGSKDTVDALLAHEGVKAVSFVGSTPVARFIYKTAAATGKRVQALGGAKNHAVVLPDCNLEFTAEALIGSAFGSAGQRCMAISAVVAVGTIGDRLVAALARKAAALTVGAGSAESVDVGPVISAQQRDRVIRYISEGLADGAQLVLDGRGASKAFTNGFFVGPTIFDGVTTEMSIYRDEIFGPLLVVLRAESLESAIAIVNQNMYGNGTAIFTESGIAAHRFQNDIEVGMVGVNVSVPVPMAFFSFGGWKSSLFGDLHVHGPEAICFYTRTKTITERWVLPEAPSVDSLSMPTLN